LDVPPPTWVPVTTALIDRPCVKTNLNANGTDRYWRIAGHLLSIAVSKFRAPRGVEAHRNQALNPIGPRTLFEVFIPFREKPHPNMAIVRLVEVQCHGCSPEVPRTHDMAIVGVHGNKVLASEFQ
jgi:hypothetical protein